MNATDRGHIEEIITHLKKVETDYHINLTSEKEWLRGLAKEESVNEDLEKEIDSYFAKWLQGASDEGCFNPDSQLVSIYDCHRIARHFANWQKKKDESYTKSMYKVGINTGKVLIKEQLMAKAVEIAREEMLNKVCEYIASNMRCDGYTLQTKSKFIKDLKQAMKNE